MAFSVSIELVSSSARVTPVKSAKGRVSELETLRPIDRTPGILGSDKNKIASIEDKIVRNYDQPR